MQTSPLRQKTDVIPPPLLRRAVGHQLKEVTYLFPSDSSWPNGYATGQADDVEEAVLLSFEDAAPISVTWAMEGHDEGLAVHEAKQVRLSPYSAVRVDGETGWRELVGTRLSAVEIVWHRAEGVARETALALVLHFADGMVRAIALGEAVDTGFSYSPQSLVVLHSQTASSRYATDVLTPQEFALSELSSASLDYWRRTPSA